MGETAHAVLRDHLRAEQSRVEGQLQQLGHGGSTDLDFDENFADSGQVTAERGEVDAIAAQLRETLADIETALEKFDEGTYGRCEICGSEIAAARLEAVPTARLCITCASNRR
jgi:DnaK suppressor protein